MEDSVKEVKTILQTLVDTALGKRAKNEKEEEKEDKKKVEEDVIVENEDVDKRDIIRQIMAIAGKREDDEVVKTIAKLAEKLAYDKSEAKTADNEDKKEKDEKEQKEDKKEAKNIEEEKPEEKEEKEQKYEDFKKEVAKETEKEVENCKAKAKNSLDELKAAFYEGTVKNDKKYMTQAQGIELGKELY